MPSLVADTHALVWHLVGGRRLGKQARRAFAAADAARWICYMPVIALIEISLLHERGCIRIGPAQVVEVIAGHLGYSVLPLDLRQALEFAALVMLRDPMDRMIVAAVRATGSRLISGDEGLSAHGVERLWD
jgi:PIN domain nuclease of toxin-antitoxin system